MLVKINKINKIQWHSEKIWHPGPIFDTFWRPFLVPQVSATITENRRLCTSIYSCKLVNRYGGGNSTTTNEVSRFQHLFPNPSWLVWGRASRHQKPAPTFPWIDNMNEINSWWLNFNFIHGDETRFSRNGSVIMTKQEIPSVAEGWLFTLYAVGKQPSIPLINLGRNGR